MSDSVPSPPPNAPFMSVWDVKCWIAFQQVREREDIDETLDFMFRWFDSDVGPTLEALEARAAPEPYYVVQPLLLDGQPWDRRSYVHRAFSPEAPKLLRAIRAKARKREGRLVTFAQLAGELRSEIARMTKENELIEHAQKELMGTVQAARLTAWARRDVKRGEENPAAVHEPVPVSIFMNELVTITKWGTIGPDPDHATAIFSYHGPQFRDVKFKTTEVLELWPLNHAKSEPNTSISAKPSRAARRFKAIGESCIIVDAIARIAYGSDYDGRYYAAPGNEYEEAEARHSRKNDVRYPTNSTLPNVPDSRQFDPEPYWNAIRHWKEEDAALWMRVEGQLFAALQAGSVKAFDTDGHAVPAEFWLANNCRSPKAHRFRIKGSELRNLGSFGSDSAGTLGMQWAPVASANPPEIIPMSDRTGMPGRPTSKHLVMAELGRRAEQRTLEATVTAEGRALAAWLSEKHPTFARMSVRTVENAIRDEFRRHKERTKI